MTTHAQARVRAIAQGPEALAAFRAKRTAEQRKRRTWLRAHGLSASGRPLVVPAQSAAQLRRWGAHPADCVCYGCLWGEADTARQPRVYRATGVS